MKMERFEKAVWMSLMGCMCYALVVCAHELKAFAKPAAATKSSVVYAFAKTR